MKSWLVLALVAGCAPDPQHPKLDGGTTHHADAANGGDGPIATDAPVGSELPAGPYAHAIAIDGTDDFTSGETFGTTSSPSYAARVTWDADRVYVGYSGPDVGGGSGTKWVFAYVDVDPGAATGATSAQQYNTQASTFPAGFGAELYARWKCDDSLASIEVFGGGSTWTTSATALAHAHAGDFVELAIPRALFPGATTLGIVTYMINEQNLSEGTYAGLYAGSFTDGYATALPITKYLKVDFSSTKPPNDPANEAP